jgi:hypothetical protein
MWVNQALTMVTRWPNQIPTHQPKRALGLLCQPSYDQPDRSPSLAQCLDDRIDSLEGDGLMRLLVLSRLVGAYGLWAIAYNLLHAH